MPAFKRFGPGDQVDNVLILEPAYNLASGSLGWRGSPEGSASLSLYGGARRSPANVVKYADYQSIFPGASSLPRPRLGLPTTASLNIVWMTDETLDITQRSSTRWGEEHWDTIQRLYQDYLQRDPDFVTGTYDYYALYFQRDSGNVLACQAGGGNPFANFTGSFTIEAWVKPFLTASTSQDFTISSVSRLFTFGITGSNGTLVFSSSVGSWTGTLGPAERRWNHVAVAYDGTSQTGSFTVNMVDAGSFTMAPLLPTANYTGTLIVGGQWSSGTMSGNSESYQNKIIGASKKSFHGMLGETRMWGSRRTVSQLSSSMSTTLTGSALNGAFTALRMVEGPLTSFASTNLLNPAPALGSGVMDWAAVQAWTTLFAPTTPYCFMWSFDDRIGPGWTVNDNPSFTTIKELATVPVTGTWPNTYSGASRSFWLKNQSIAQVHRMIVIDVPQAFYGRQIVPGSVTITDRTYSSGSYGMIRVLNDDGRGNLYVSGSVCSSSLAAKEDYAGVVWNKVGNVFYGEGLIVIKDPTLLDFGSIHDSPSASSHPNDLLQLSFRGQSRVPVKTLMCRVDRGDFNATSNPTFWTEDVDGNRVPRHASGNLYATTVGVYNSQRELVGVARLADPVRVRSRDRFNFRLRMDF